jgi:hypothetical protein
MLTVEYRVNGQLIGVTNIVNNGSPGYQGYEQILEKDDTRNYTVEHFASNKEIITRFYIKHKRSDGFEELVRKALMKLKRSSKDDSQSNKNG